VCVGRSTEAGAFPTVLQGFGAPSESTPMGVAEMPDFDAAVDARMRRWQEQRWILDAVIQTLGVEWDQARIGYCLAPCGPQATADFMGVRQRVRRFSDISREFARAADRRRALGERHEREDHLVTARARSSRPPRPPSSSGSCSWPAMRTRTRSTAFASA
jgi:hypothetical protein